MEKFIVDYWYILVLLAAFFHAVWNILLKNSENKEIFLWSLEIWSLIIFLPISIYFWPDSEISIKYFLLWGIGSAVIHSIYALLLTKSYEYNDFTVAYPIARGTGPLIVVVIGVVFLKEDVNIIKLIGTLLIVFGVFIMYSGLSLKNGLKTLATVKNNPWPILVGIAIASYTIFDKLAVAFIPPVILYVIETTGQVIVLGKRAYKQGTKNIFNQWKKYWYKMALAGTIAGMAYILVLIVLTEIPVSYVSPLRESSIVIGSILGLVFLKESFSTNKIIGSLIIFTGVVLIIV